METIELFKQIERLKSGITRAGNSHDLKHGIRAQVCEFLKQFAGSNSSFSKLAENTIDSKTLNAVLDNFKEFVEAGLLSQITPVRQAQLNVVSDFLEQAQYLLQGKNVHPATPIVLIGATLEEFLRTWIESAEISLGNRKPSLETYGQVLMAQELITKQDMKDIISWGGLRNHAAHGEWAEVSDKQRASIMLEGVNLFMRKYGV